MSSSAPDRYEEALALLLTADEAGLTSLAARFAAVAPPLAEALRATYLASHTQDTARAAAAARALAALAAVSAEPAVVAQADWIAGLAALQLEGRVERAIQYIDVAYERLAALGRLQDAAATQVSKVGALALLGHYDEAIACGLQARSTFLAYGDVGSAGRVELNLGNIFFQRNQYDEAAEFYRDARTHLTGAGDLRMLVAVDNGLANVLVQRLSIAEAAALYEQALESAAALGMEAAQASIESNLGALALFQGRYNQALDYLERSRRRYASLAMPHESALTELELANAYAELNLSAEAAAIYARVTQTFAGLDMRAEQAYTLLHHGRTAVQLGRPDEAWTLLDEARSLYVSQGNPVGVALVTLAAAQLAFREGNYKELATAAGRAAPVFAEAGDWRDHLLARWLAAEAARALGDSGQARTALEATLAAAETHSVPRIAQRCLTSLGRLALSTGERERAEHYLHRAVALAEALRAPLPADEIRAAFASETVAPYTDLVRLCLDDPAGPRVNEAFAYAEAGRARALLELLADTARLPAGVDGLLLPAEQARASELRIELNWLYNRLARPLDPDESPAARNIQIEGARRREQELAELRRRSALGSSTLIATPLDLAALQQRLGHDTALVAYLDLNGELMAFVVTDTGVAVVRALGTPGEVQQALTALHFQIGALSYGAAVRQHAATLAERTRRHLATLYELLLRPLDGLLGERRLVVAPHGPLHYVPFNALHDGTSFVIERREVCLVPSAAVLLRTLERPRATVRTALVLGVADEHAPRVREEARGLAPLFAHTTLLLDEAATLPALRAAAGAVDLVHFACHGSFRPESPLFSALRLGDGWLTVNEVYDLELRCQLVTLSACETGISAVAPGDELLGLTRGFFSAGAPALCVSLWAVDDAATAELMNEFYRRLLAGATPATALRAAQLQLLHTFPHPFFWASFTLVGRW